MTTAPASEKQIRFIDSLLSERVLPAGYEKPSSMDKRRASSLITWLMAQPRKPRETSTAAQPEIGIYVLQDGTIVQAKMNQRKTNVYTKRWVEIRGERLVDATEEHVHGEWEYDPDLKRQLDSARVMTLQEAKDFILRYGQCVRCGRRLKAAQSVERGIGPVCIRYFEQFAAA